MKYFICGGSGFVGQHFVRRLEAAGQQVRIYDKVVSRTGNGVCGDIHDRELLISTMRGSGIVIHLASNADISKSASDPSIDFHEGTELTQNVLEAMRITGVREMIYFSGSGVYGDYPTKVFHEDHGPLRPISTYGASKLASEALIYSYHAMFGIRAAVFRPANIVGPGQTHGVGFDFIRRLKSDPRRLCVLGDGYQSKSYIHIDDVLDAVMLAGITGHEVLNLASNDDITVRDIAEMAVLLTKSADCLIEYTGGDRGWNGDVPRINLDCAKIRSLGWSPKYTSARAIHDAMESML